MASRSDDRADTPADIEPRRAALRQTRSRETRRKLIRAALDLWSERGFERALEETTAEEIASAAGVSRGTFYFHFSQKEDILFEMPWATAEVMLEEASRAMERAEPTSTILEALMVSLARRVARAPRPAVLRVSGQWSQLAHSDGLPDTPRGFAETFRALLSYGCERGEVHEEVDVDETSSILLAATMDALVRWAATTQSAVGLRDALCRRADVVLRGAGASYGS